METLPQWDLKRLYESPEAESLKRDFAGLERLAGEFRARYRGRIGGLAPEELAAAFSEHEAIHKIFARLGLYSHLLFAENTANPEAQRLGSNFDELAARVHSQIVFFDLEIGSHGTRFIESPAVKHYSYFIRKSVETARYNLSEELESYGMEKNLSGREALTGIFDEFYGSFKFEMDTTQGRKSFTSETALATLHLPERDYRTQVYSKFLERVGENRIVLNGIYNSIMLEHRLNYKRRGYSGMMEPRNIRNEVTNESVAAMLEASESGFALAQRYFRLKAELLGIKEFTNADIYAPIESEVREIPFDHAKGLTLRAYSAFDAGVGKIIERFFGDRRVETPLRDGKRPGAFCYGASPDLDAYVFMNYTPDIRSVQTLAHELGHGLHHQLSKKQNHLLFDTPLVTAETASVFGEILLNELLLEESKSPREKLSILCSQIEGIIATVFRQTVLTRFEQAAHGARESGKVQAETLCDLWWAENKKLYGDAVQMVESYRWGWAYIPHFIHTPFYCYAYSYGQLLVLALYDEYARKGGAFVSGYLDLLSSGGSDSPAALVGKSVGLDLNDPSFWRRSLGLLEKNLRIIENLV